MKSDISFQQILERKLQQKTDQTQSSQRTHSYFDNVNWLNFKIAYSKKSNQHYPQSGPQQPTPETTPTESKKVENNFSPSVIESPCVDKNTLNSCQLLSLELLNRWGAELNQPLIYKKDLKKAFRKLAIKYHPDSAQTKGATKAPEIFQAIKEAYDNLSQSFNY